MSKILIVEDDEPIAQGLRDNLEFEHYEVAIATDGQTALNMIRERCSSSWERETELAEQPPSAIHALGAGHFP